MWGFSPHKQVKQFHSRHQLGVTQLDCDTLHLGLASDPTGLWLQATKLPSLRCQSQAPWCDLCFWLAGCQLEFPWLPLAASTCVSISQNSKTHFAAVYQLIHRGYNKEHAWTDRWRGMKGEVCEGSEPRSFCPYESEGTNLPAHECIQFHCIRMIAY
jgi:hypothetical protein